MKSSTLLARLTRHDVGNKLMVMKSNIYLLKKKIGNNSKSSDWPIEASMSLANYLIPKLNNSGKEN